MERENYALESYNIKLLFYKFQEKYKSNKGDCALQL